jgi:hypothetical protein
MLLLPLLAFLGCWARLYARNRDWRGSSIVAAILWGVWLALATEILSSITRLSAHGIAAAWLLAAALAWLAAIRAMKTPSTAAADSRVQPAPVTFSGIERASIGAIGAILVLTAVIALVAAPDSWDAMQYNLPRAIMWLENHSVRMYPTVDYQQLMMSPWADYTMMHLIALQGSDRFADLVAWFSFGGSILGVSLIARELGASRSTQILASLLCATIPSAILFASSCKPDETISFWFVASVFCLLRWRSAPNWPNALLAAGAIGLTVMSKGTAYVLLPAILAAAFWIWPQDRRRKFLPWIPVAAAVVLMLNGPLYVRNMRLSGSPIGFASPDGDADTLGERHFANGTFKPQDIAANVLRNAALHFRRPQDDRGRKYRRRNFLWTNEALSDREPCGRPLRSFTVLRGCRADCPRAATFAARCSYPCDRLDWCVCPVLCGYSLAAVERPLCFAVVYGGMRGGCGCAG